MFDVADHLDELRCWPTERLVAQHDHLVREQRRLHIEDLDAPPNKPNNSASHHHARAGPTAA